MPVLLDRPSPNHGERRPGTPVDVLLIHYTGLPTAEVALERLCSPEAGVSAHYTIDEAGTVWRHVAEHRRAWHAGLGGWRGDRDLNSRSIGIELVNRGHEFGYQPFPAAQMAALLELARDLIRRHRIRPDGVLGHSDIACTRKIDPGEGFDWQRLAGLGVGLWPQPAAVDYAAAAEGELERLLARYGYDLETQPLPAVLAAFHRHFRPEPLTAAADGETLARLRALVRAAGR
jgi:N-acetylmuramoyl-L-alanine amidase